MTRIIAFFRSRWLAERLQIGLGAIFVYAAWPKLVDPPTFAKNVHAYDLLPDFLINLQAIALPGVELVVGLALIVGIWRRAAALLCGLMLLQFMAAIGMALANGNPVNCSCFDLNAVAKTDLELLAEMRNVLLRDVAVFAMALVTFFTRQTSNLLDAMGLEDRA